MSRKQLLPAVKINSATSLATSFQTSAIRVETADNIGVWIYCNSVTDNTGTFAIQLRPWRDNNTYGDWITLTLDTVPTLAGADADFFVNLNQIPNCQLRASFVAAGGTPDGNCDIWVSGTGA